MAWYIEEQARVYVDYNATTPLDEEVETAIIGALKVWGNPSSNSPLGTKAKNVIEKAREKVGQLLHISPKGVYFTSGGTETNRWVIHNCIEHRKAVQGREYKPHIIASAFEHPSILNTLRDLKNKQEIDFTEIGIDPETGYVKLNELEAAFSERTCLVSVMMANNETGVIQPVAAVAEIARKQGEKFESRMFVHSDAAQAIGKIDVNVDTLQVDFVTVVGHKFYGPRIGALVIRQRVPLTSMFLGGNQEDGKRAGTENTPMIVGLGKAAEVANSRLTEITEHMQKVRDYFEKRLKETLGEDAVVIHFEKSDRIPNTSSVAFVKYNGNASELLSKCKTFIASTGAACHAATLRCSPALSACGIKDDLAIKTVRFSFGRESTCEDADRICTELKAMMFLGKHGGSLLDAINKGPVPGF